MFGWISSLSISRDNDNVKIWRYFWGKSNLQTQWRNGGSGKGNRPIFKGDLTQKHTYVYPNPIDRP